MFYTPSLIVMGTGIATKKFTIKEKNSSGEVIERNEIISLSTKMTIVIELLIYIIKKQGKEIA